MHSPCEVYKIITQEDIHTDEIISQELERITQDVIITKLRARKRTGDALP